MLPHEVTISINRVVVLHAQDLNQLNRSPFILLASAHKRVTVPNLRDVVTVDTDVPSDECGVETIIDRLVVEMDGLCLLHVIIKRNDVVFLDIALRDID